MYHDDWIAKRVEKLICFYGADFFRDKTVLVVGAQPIDFSLVLAELGAHVTCVDTARRLNDIKRKNSEITCVQAAHLGREWPLAGKFFDFTLHLVNLPHIIDIDRHLTAVMLCTNYFVLDTKISDGYYDGYDYDGYEDGYEDGYYRCYDYSCPDGYDDGYDDGYFHRHHHHYHHYHHHRRHYRHHRRYHDYRYHRRHLEYPTIESIEQIFNNQGMTYQTITDGYDEHQMLAAKRYTLQAQHISTKPPRHKR